MVLGPARQVAIAGVGLTEVGRRLGRSTLDLSAEALQLALDDAQLGRDDVDGMVSNVGFPLAPDYDRMAEAFGLGLRGAMQTWSHGRFVGTAVQAAVQAVS